MKKLIITLVILLIANIAGAIIDDTPNSIGLYWDTEANVVDGVNYTPFVAGHIIITNPTFPTFKAIELALQVRLGDGELLSTAGILCTDPTEMGPSSTCALPQIVYAANPPVPTTPVFEILQIALGLPQHGLDPRYTTEETNWYLVPAPNATVPGVIIVLPVRGEDLVELIPVTPNDEPVAKLNGVGVVSSEVVSWGEVRNLYR